MLRAVSPSRHVWTRWGRCGYRREIAVLTRVPAGGRVDGKLGCGSKLCWYHAKPVTTQSIGFVDRGCAKHEPCRADQGLPCGCAPNVEAGGWYVLTHRSQASSAVIDHPCATLLIRCDHQHRECRRSGGKSRSIGVQCLEGWLGR